MRLWKKHLLLLGVGLMGLAMAVIVFVSRESEPSYEGKKLSQWISQLDPARPEITTQARHEAQDALRHMGTNALPYLIEWLQYETPGWKATVYGIVNRVLRTLNPRWDLEDKRDRVGQVFLAFSVLGDDARPAIPELSRLVTGPKADVGAAMVLSWLGDAGLQALVRIVTNEQATLRSRVTAIGQIRRMGTNATSAIPALQQMLWDTNRTMRYLATNAIREIDPETLEKGRAQE